MKELLKPLGLLILFWMSLPLARASLTPSDDGNSSQTTNKATLKQEYWDLLKESQQRLNEQKPKTPLCGEAMFIGPRAENKDLLKELVIEAVDAHLDWRTTLHVGDPIHINDDKMKEQSYQDSKENLKTEVKEFLSNLQSSVPFFSLRYQGHMIWENTIPSIVGYIGAMLYNQNNITFEAGPVTTFFEEETTKDLCRLIGYPVFQPDTTSTQTVYAGGHLTCDGTVANIEALWAALHVKFFPLAVKWAFEDAQHKPSHLLHPAVGLKVKVWGKEEELLRLSPWSLLNLESDYVIDLPKAIQGLIAGSKTNAPSIDVIYNCLAEYSLNKLGLVGIYQRLRNTDIKEPVLLVAGTRHYSFPKAMSLLGLGQKSLISVKVDQDARLDLAKLKKKIIKFAESQTPILAVTAIMGTTEESAVDPLREIINLRTKFRKENTIDFYIHADAAWGGYQRSLLRRGPSVGVPVVPFSAYVKTQMESLNEADSVTMDPHKSGYIPYPAGGICFRNTQITNFINFTAPYVSSHKEGEPMGSSFGVEGSKPGASAASVYLSHRVIPLTDDGLGIITGQALFSTKKFYLGLVNLDDSDVIVVPLPRLPSQRLSNPSQEYIDKEKQELAGLAKKYLNTKNENDGDLAEFGPDLNILTYAFNFRTDKNLNSDLSLLNDYNKAIYDRLRPQHKEDMSTKKLFVSATTLDTKLYGHALLQDFSRRLGIAIDPSQEDYSVMILRSVIMNPWVTETSNGTFIDVIMAELVKTAKEEAEKLSSQKNN